MTDADDPTPARDARSSFSVAPSAAQDAQTPTHGVGPWPGGPEEWPDDPRYDPELLAEGDRRNVVDGYRYWSMDAIVADLDAKRHPFHVAIENWQHDLNIGTIVRSANAFLAAEVHIVGKRRWTLGRAAASDQKTEHKRRKRHDHSHWNAPLKRLSGKRRRKFSICR